VYTGATETFMAVF